MVIAIRFLGADNFGHFSSLLAVVSILSKLVDFGIEPIVFRELSRDKNNFHFFNAGLNLRFLIYIILVIGFNIFAPFLSFTPREILLSNILFVTIILSAKMVVVRELMATPFKVNLKMHYPMLFSILDNLFLFAMIFVIPFVNDPVLYFVIAYALSNLPGFILLFYFLNKKFDYRYEVTLEKSGWLLKESLTLFGFVVLTSIFMQIDIVILSSFKDNADVGIYSAGARLTMPLSIIPGAIVTTVFPILVKKMADNENTEYITNLVIKLLYFIAFIMAAVFTFESAAISTLIFGNEFIKTAQSASILYWCQIFLFFGFYSLSVLLASNQQHYNFIYSGIQVVINLALCFILIPKYSYVGAAIAKLIASFISFLFILYALNKFGFKPSIGRYRVLTWSVILVLILWLLSSLPVIPYLTAASIVIAAVTIITKLFSYQEIITIFKLINREELGKKILLKLTYK